VLIAKLGVNAEMVFLDLPFYERISRLKELGFRVGLWGLDGHQRGVS
jgi:hydroxypyruvate isomerase